jgi:hypothetical protein
MPIEAGVNVIEDEAQVALMADQLRAAKAMMRPVPGQQPAPEFVSLVIQEFGTKQEIWQGNKADLERAQDLYKTLSLDSHFFEAYCKPLLDKLAEVRTRQAQIRQTKDKQIRAIFAQISQLSEQQTALGASIPGLVRSGKSGEARLARGKQDDLALEMARLEVERVKLENSIYDELAQLYQSSFEAAQALLMPGLILKAVVQSRMLYFQAATRSWLDAAFAEMPEVVVQKQYNDERLREAEARVNRQIDSTAQQILAGR